MTQPPSPPTTEEPVYRPPRLIVLGTLHQLTQGGTTGPADGQGGAGASGIIP